MDTLQQRRVLQLFKKLITPKLNKMLNSAGWFYGRTYRIRTLAVRIGKLTWPVV